MNIRRNIYRLDARAKKIKSKLIRDLEKIPNGVYQISNSPSISIVPISQLKLTWDANFYDSTVQAAVIIKMIRKSSLSSIESNIDSIINTGRAINSSYCYMRFNDDIRDYLKKIFN